MKIFAIGIFKKSGEEETIQFDDNNEGKTAAEYISQILIKSLANAEIHGKEMLDHCKCEMHYYIRSNGSQFFIIASQDENNYYHQDAIKASFDDLLNMSASDYSKLHEKIADATFLCSRTKKIEKDLELVKLVTLANIDKVLQRGERIEILVDKTNQLAGKQPQFNQLQRKKNAKPDNKISNIFCCLFCCGKNRKKPAKNEYELREHLLHRYEGM